MAKTSDLIRYLNDNGVRYQLLSHVPAFKAHDVAAVTHVQDREMAKTLIVKSGPLFWMVVLRADQKIDEHLLKHALEVHHVHLASEEDLELLFPDCQVGAMPPFGNLYGFPVIVDKSLTADDEIVFNACTHTESIKMKFADYERLVRPLIAEIAASERSTKEKEYF